MLKAIGTVVVVLAVAPWLITLVMTYTPHEVIGVYGRYAVWASHVIANLLG